MKEEVIREEREIEEKRLEEKRRGSRCSCMLEDVGGVRLVDEVTSFPKAKYICVLYYYCIELC